MSKYLTFSLKAVAGAALVALAGSAMAAAEFGANVELDNTNRSGSSVGTANEGLSQAGRVEVGVSAKVGAGAFVAGRTSFLTQKNGTVSTDDMWVQLGNASGDVKLGRFEAADLFPLIADTLVNHAGAPGAVYGTNTLRGRMGSDVFHAAGTLNLGGANSIEIGYIDGTKSTVATVGAKGLRAVASFGAGALSGRIGVESGEYAPVGAAPANKIQGWGLTATYDAGSFKVTGNYSNGKQDRDTNNAKSAYALSLGVGAFGAGYVAATNNNASGGDDKIDTVYAAYSIPLFGVKGASLTPAVSTSTSKDSGGTSTTENAVRVRIHYDF